MWTKVRVMAVLLYLLLDYENCRANGDDACSLDSKDGS